MSVHEEHERPFIGIGRPFLVKNQLEDATLPQAYCFMLTKWGDSLSASGTPIQVRSEKVRAFGKV